MSHPLAGKAALVTGGSRGIGAAIVRRLANDGAAVAFTYAAAADKAQALVKEVGAVFGRVFAIKADSAEPEAVRKAVSQTVEELGGLDILVNNAGILMLGVIDDYALADFDRMVAVNVRPGFGAVPAALPHRPQGERIFSTGRATAARTASPAPSPAPLPRPPLAA